MLAGAERLTIGASPLVLWPDDPATGRRVAAQAACRHAMDGDARWLAPACAVWLPASRGRNEEGRQPHTNLLRIINTPGPAKECCIIELVAVLGIIWKRPGPPATACRAARVTVCSSVNGSTS